MKTVLIRTILRDTYMSYGEEGEFYLVFTVSSRSQSGFNSAVVAYEKLIAGYRK